MSQRLAGRLTWETTRNGIRVAIPTRRSAITVLYGAVVGIWLVAVSIYYGHVLGVPHGNDHEFMFQLIAFSVYALGFCFAICWLVWTFTNETILTLDAAKLTIQRRAMGIELFTESYPTMSVSDVTFIATMRSWTIRKNIDSRTGGIQFQAGSRAHTFASGIAEVEARALISRMLAVHKFPNNVESRDVRALN